MTSIVEEHDKVEEGLDGYTKASREFVEIRIKVK